MTQESDPQISGENIGHEQIENDLAQDPVIRPEESDAMYDPNIDRARLRAYAIDPYVSEAIKQRDNARETLRAFEKDQYISSHAQVYENAAKRGELAIKAMQRADQIDRAVSEAYDKSVGLASDLINGKRPQN